MTNPTKLTTLCLIASTAAAQTASAADIFTGFLNTPDYGALAEISDEIAQNTSPWANVDLSHVAQLALEFNDAPSGVFAGPLVMETVQVDTGDAVWAFDSLQDAIDFAQPGDIIELRDGPYYGPYTIDGKNDLVIRSGNLGSPCTINGQGEHRGFIITTSSQITLSHLQFTDCSTDPNAAATQQGAAVSASQSNDLLIEFCTFTGNTARLDGGGAVAVTNSASPTVRDCIFSSNFANLPGGALLALNTSDFSLTDCLFSHNTSFVSGGAVALHNAAKNAHDTIRDCTFFDNNAADGGALCLNVGLDSPGKTFVYDCSFVGNRAVGLEGRGGALLMEMHATAYMYDCLFAQQRAGHGAVADLTGAAYLSAERCAMVGNRVSNGEGLCSALDSSYATFDAPITDCQARLSVANGGEVFATGSRSDLLGCGYAADLNLDGHVNTTDLIALLQEWGPAYRSRADIHSIDGGRVDHVDVVDLWALISDWGEETPDPLAR
ncbi:MAG: right-handed parallel beta-helix repeat-containing protein [Phycisphaerales bacterium]|nr:right-handed parallel beta-helix repeat-containing protein [Phycisphaerales bacterium]